MGLSGKPTRAPSTLSSRTKGSAQKSMGARVGSRNRAPLFLAPAITAFTYDAARRCIQIMTAFRKNVFAWACIMGAIFLFGLGALYLSEFFLVPFFALILSAKFVLDRITCLNCGTSVTYQGTFAGVKVSGGFIRRRCQQCGWDLDKELS
jgi:hypothetical protein